MNEQETPTETRSSYRVNCSRNPDGTYTLSYGKGSKKLTVTMAGKPGEWAVGNGDYSGEPYQNTRTKAECIKQWGEWAAKWYNRITPLPGGVSKETPLPVGVSKPSPTPLPMSEEPDLDLIPVEHMTALDHMEAMLDFAARRRFQLHQMPWYGAIVHLKKAGRDVTKYTNPTPEER